MLPEKLTAAIRFIFPFGSALFFISFVLFFPSLSFVRLAFSREKFSMDFFPFRVKNRLRWIPLLLLYLFQFLSHFYFYFDLMMLYFRSVCFSCTTVKAKCVHKSDSETYICAMCTDHNRTCVLVLVRSRVVFQNFKLSSISKCSQIVPNRETSKRRASQSIIVNNLWSKMDENVNCLTP